MLGEILTHCKSKTILTRSMLTISLSVFTDNIQGRIMCQRSTILIAHKEYIYLKIGLIQYSRLGLIHYQALYLKVCNLLIHSAVMII